MSTQGGCKALRHSLRHGSPAQFHSRSVNCAVAAPLFPQGHSAPLSLTDFRPRVDPAQQGTAVQESPNLAQHQSTSPEPLYARLRKECHSGRSTDAVLFTVMVVCAQAASKLAGVHSAGGVLNELDIDDFQWVSASPGAQATAAGELLLTATPQPTEDLGHDATPWKQYDVLQLATTVAAAIASATARNDDFARPFAHAPAAMQAEEVPNVLESVGVSPRVSRCLELALGARPGEDSPTATQVGSVLAYEAIKVLAQGEYRASAQELQALTALCSRLGLKGMEALVEGSGEFVRRRARELQESRAQQQPC